jgi:hypothetical protein
MWSLCYVISFRRLRLTSQTGALLNVGVLGGAEQEHHKRGDDSFNH